MWMLHSVLKTYKNKPMKKTICLIILLTLLKAAYSQDSFLHTADHNAGSFISKPYTLSARENGESNPISKFAISINPLGFLQFGPIVSAEIGLKDNLVLNVHARVPFLGLLPYLINEHNDGLDNLMGFAFGAGSIYFFGTRQHKPYAGVLLEYDHLKLLYAQGDSWEWDKSVNSVVFIMNGGYRFRFNGGFFINTGAFLGAAIGRYKWDYSDPSYGEYDYTAREGTDVTPFGMLEVTIGIEF